MNFIIELVIRVAILTYIIGMPIWVYRLSKRVQQLTVNVIEGQDVHETAIEDLEDAVAELERPRTIRFYREFKL